MTMVILSYVSITFLTTKFRKTTKLGVGVQTVLAKNGVWDRELS